MNQNSETLIKTQISECTSLLQNTLGEDFLGLYLYGSSVVGGLQKYSDIDLFAVINRETTLEEKSKLAKALLSISGVYMKSEKRPVELTTVVKSQVNPWKYPPKFDFQYGDWLRKDFESRNNEPWKSKEMPDLAILITQILIASKTVYGPEPKTLLAPVPRKDLVTASVKELDNLLADIEHDTRNVLLTFARIWYTLENNKIASKPEAALWAVEKLPDEYKEIMQRAHDICIGKFNDDWNGLTDTAKECSNFMISKIREKAKAERQEQFTS